MIENTRAPRSGGRTTERQSSRTTRTPKLDGDRPVRASNVDDGPGIRATKVDSGRGIRAHRFEPRRVEREFPTQGSAALRPAERATTPPAGGPRLKVAPPPPVTGPRVPFVALILVLVVGGVLGILVVNTKIAENAFRIERLQQTGAALDIQEQELQREIADAEAPGNLTAEARKLGLIGGGTPAYIRLQDGKIIGIPRPGDGDPAVTSDQTPGR